MSNKKIAMVVKKTSFKEAEEDENVYWSQQSELYRLSALMDLRAMVFGATKYQSIRKVVYKRSFHEKAET